MAKPIGTGLSSTLLSSQRTTTHRTRTPSQETRSGHSLNFTRAISQRQIRVFPVLREDFAQVPRSVASGRGPRMTLPDAIS